MSMGTLRKSELLFCKHGVYLQDRDFRIPTHGLSERWKISIVINFRNL